MPNQIFVCPTVSKKIGETTFELRMDFNAISLAEKLTGRNLLDSKIWADMDASTVTALFWACAAQTDDKLTLGEVRRSTFKHAADMTDAVREAFKLANDAPEGEPRPMSGSTVQSARAH